MVETEFTRAARLKWPYAKITGDGPYALVCSHSNTVRLFGYWFNAATEVVKQCGAWDCRDVHRLVELEPVYEIRRPAIRNLALMERD